MLIPAAFYRTRAKSTRLLLSKSDERAFHGQRRSIACSSWALPNLARATGEAFHGILWFHALPRRSGRRSVLSGCDAAVMDSVLNWDCLQDLSQWCSMPSASQCNTYEQSVHRQWVISVPQFRDQFGCIKQALIGIIIQRGCLLSCVVVYVERFGLRDELDMHCFATVQHDL